MGTVEIQVEGLANALSAIAPLLEQYQRSFAFIKRNLRHIQTDRGFNTLGELEIPEQALEELLVNALIHRDYFTSASIRLMEFAHLFSIFDGSRVHQQVEKSPGADDAPPGLYFTIINPRLIESQHKNKLGVFQRTDAAIDLFIEDMHIDHYYLKEHQTPPNLGTLAFTLCAITAHLAGMGRITLIAADGQGSSARYVGAKVWPKLGFDAPLLPGETADAPHLANCTTVQDIVTLDEAWWTEHGTQRWMAFDLGAHSMSWKKLIPYADRKVPNGRPS